MYARHRSPGNGYRISPEGSGSGRGQYRNYNRGFGRGQPKPAFQPPPPPPLPRRGDIFVEAGRLATDYLVAKGILPSSVLSGKWPNGSSLKNQVGDFQFSMVQEGGEILQDGGRPSVLARLGDGDAGRRRSADDFSPMGSKSNMRGRRRMGTFKGSGSEWNREMGRSGSWSERGGRERGEDAFAEHMEEQQGGKDRTSEEQKSVPSDVAMTSLNEGNSASGVDKNQVSDNFDLKASSSVSGKDVVPEADGESRERGNSLMDDSSNGESEKASVTEDISSAHNCAEEDNSANKSGGSDLLTLCRFAKVPTRTRSSLTTRGSKIDCPVLIAEDENVNEYEKSRESGVPLDAIPVDASLGGAPSDQSQSRKHLESNILEEPDRSRSNIGNKVPQGLGTRIQSFTDRLSVNKLYMSELNRNNSMFMERGEKRAPQQSDTSEGAKKPRDWAPLDGPKDDHLHTYNLSGNHQSSQEVSSSSEEVILATDQKKAIDVSLFPKAEPGSCIEYTEEKQLFPGSFKICDLNLMESSDVNENHDNSGVVILPSIEDSKKEAEPVDVGLSMGSYCNVTDKRSICGADVREIEVIDLESDSVQEDTAFNNSDRKDDAIFRDLESFPDNARNGNKISDAQDGYGLMISELLDSDISPVPPGINSTHNEMNLDDGEGILGDDDSIYMSLGEIPISFLRPWEQPGQEYGKPY